MLWYPAFRSTSDTNFLRYILARIRLQSYIGLYNSGVLLFTGIKFWQILNGCPVYACGAKTKAVTMGVSSSGPTYVMRPVRIIVSICSSSQASTGGG
jgi:hypothetical protein